MTSKDLTTLDMELILMKHFDFTQKIIVPNVTDMSRLVRFETDLLILSKSNYATGIEIKISKADLLNDLSKKQYGKTYKNGQIKSLQERYYYPYKYFYYAVPDFLVEDVREVVHPFCGILSVEVEEHKDWNDEVYYLKSVVEARKPQLINNSKWTEQQVLHLLKLGNMRVFNLKKNLSKAIPLQKEV